MPVTTINHILNKRAARAFPQLFICGPPVIKIAHPWYSLVFVAYLLSSVHPMTKTLCINTVEATAAVDDCYQWLNKFGDWKGNCGPESTSDTEFKACVGE